MNQDQSNSFSDGLSGLEHANSAGSSTLNKPTGIDNSDLVYDGDGSHASPEIQDTLLEGRDYVLLPQEVWNRLYTW